jgi:Ca2+/Na+ antiporter
MDYCFAVKRGNTELYSILNKVNSTIPESIMNIALNSYYIKDGTNSDFKNYLIENRDFNIASLFIMLSLFLVFLYLSIRSHRKDQGKRQELISATESDKLTGLYMKSYFYEYIERIYSEDPLKPMDAIVFNIIQFHSVNAIISRAFGDEVLQAIGAELLAFTEENGGIACRARRTALQFTARILMIIICCMTGCKTRLIPFSQTPASGCAWALCRMKGRGAAADG